MKYIEVLNAFEDLRKQILKESQKQNVSRQAITLLLKIKHYSFKSQKDIVEYILRHKADIKDKDKRKIKVVISNALRELEETKLIKRVSDDNDRRIKFISLSKRAVSIVEKFEGGTYG